MNIGKPAWTTEQKNRLKRGPIEISIDGLTLTLTGDGVEVALRASAIRAYLADAPSWVDQQIAAESG